MNEKSNFLYCIEQAIVIPASNEMRSLPDMDHEFSSAYRKKINRLIKDINKPYYPLIKTRFRKIVCLIAAIILMSTVTVAAVPQLREWFIGLFVEQNEKNADVYAVKGEIPTDEMTLNYIYSEPTFVPDGFSETNRLIEHGNLFIDYASEEDLHIFFYQTTLPSNNQINSENTFSEQLRIKDYNAILSYNDDTCIIVWNDNKYSYRISGDISKNDIISMANSV